MSSALQNRLVGTVIIVAIAVIFLPDLLDGKQESTRDLFVKLPQKPVMKTVTVPKDFDTEKVENAVTRKVEVISEQAVDEEPTDISDSIEVEQANPIVDVKVVDEYEDKNLVAKPATTNSLEQQTVVKRDKDRLLASAGWVVQLGSFRHQKNVKELLSRLDKAGYRAFSRPVKTNSGTLTKVFVGPDLQKTKLEGSLSHLKELTKLQGRVTPFTVQ